MSNPKPARPAVQSTAPAAEAPAVEAPAVEARIAQTEVISNDDAPRSRTIVESNDAVQVEIAPEVESEEQDRGGTVITTFVGVQPGIAFADAGPAEAAAADNTAAAIAAFAEQD